MEDIRKCKKRGRRGLSWTSAQKGLSKTVAPGGVAATGCACVGFGAVQAHVFCPRRLLEVIITVAGAYFRGRGACTQYDPKIILGAKSLDPKGDAYYGS